MKQKNTIYLILILFTLYSNRTYADNYYNELKDRAHKIFQQIKKASKFCCYLDFEIKDEKSLWIRACRNNLIKMSKEALLFCYKDGIEIGDQRLAFLLGHEIYHVNQGHLDYIKNFMTDLKNYSLFSKFLNQIKLEADIEKLKAIAWEENDRNKYDILYKIEKIHENELKADENGLMIAAIAGFEIKNIIDFNGMSFFHQWEEKLKQTQSSSLIYPPSENRLENLKQHIHYISNNIWLFRTGLRLYKIKKYDDALKLFTPFERIFSDSSVFNNIGMTYYQKAIHSEEYSKCKNKSLFKLSTDYDSETKACVYQKTRNDIYKKNIEDAKTAFKASLNIDENYHIASINYSSMDLVHSLCPPDSKYTPYNALSILESLPVTITQGNSLKITNNCAIAKYLVDKTKIDDAIHSLEKCIKKITPTNDHQWSNKDIFNVCYNLNHLYLIKGYSSVHKKRADLVQKMKKYNAVIPCKKELDNLIRENSKKTKKLLGNILPGKCFEKTVENIESGEKIKGLNKKSISVSDNTSYVVYQNNHYMICLKKEHGLPYNILFIEKITKSGIEDMLSDECLKKIRQHKDDLSIFIDDVFFEIEKNQNNNVMKETYYEKNEKP